MRKISVLVTALVMVGTNAEAGDPSDRAALQARGLLQQAGTMRKAGRTAEAVAVVERAVGILERAYGKKDLTVGIALENLAVLYEENGQPAKAIGVLERALVIQMRQEATNPQPMLDIATRLAVRYAQAGRYDLAVPVLEKILATKERVGARDGLLGPLSQLAVAHTRLGQFDRAIPYAEQTVAIAKKKHGPNHPEMSTAYGNLATIYADAGRFEEADDNHAKALAIAEDAPGENAKYVATALTNMAASFRRAGRFRNAISALERVLMLDTQTYGDNHPRVAETLHNLGSVHADSGAYVEAERLVKRALEMREKHFGKNHPTVADTANALGKLYRRTGQHAKAEKAYQRALRIFLPIASGRHPEVAKTLNNLAILFADQRKWDESEAHYQRALKLQERLLGKDHLRVAATVHNKAIMYLQQNDVRKARPLLKRVERVYRKQLPADSVQLAGLLNTMASLHLRAGAFARAEKTLQQALAIFRKAYGASHPNVGVVLTNLLGAYVGMKDLDRAVATATQISEVLEHNVQLMLQVGDEARKRAFMGTVTANIHALVALHQRYAPKRDDAARLALTTVLRYKGRVLDAQAETLGRARKHLDAEGKALLEQLGRCRTQQASASLGGRGTLSTSQFERVLSELSARCDGLSAQLAERSASFAAEHAPVAINAVAAAIPQGAALVEIINFPTFDLDGSWGAWRYMAYVLHPDGAMHSVDLNEAKPIDEAIAQLRAAIKARQKVEKAARKVDALIMAPVRAATKKVDHWLISPDGALWLAPLDAAQADSGAFLIESLRLTYLTSGRDLLRLDERSKPRTPPFVMADPDLSSFGGNWTPIPGTGAEAATIAALLPNAKSYTSGQATEALLKTVEGPHFLHIATHGFFLTKRRAAPGGRGLIRVRQETYVPENPLLRSGLVLTPTEAPTSEDGILTAAELSAVDLLGTKLAVLSACETGVGAVQSGEGVFGLRRALVLAGTESQVMSLWKVSDQATQKLMTTYYRELVAGLGRTEALRQARRSFLKHEKWRHPYFWAGFIPSGDWRPLGDLAVATRTAPAKQKPSTRATEAQPSPPTSGPDCACDTAQAPQGRAPWLFLLFAVIGLLRPA